MKNLIKVSSMLGAAVLGVSLTSAGVANAATVNTTNDGGTSTATVNLDADPDNNTIKLLQVTDFDFGSALIGGDALKMSLNTAQGDLAVSNPGLDTGWSVTVAGTDFTTADGTGALKGAVLTLDGDVAPQDSTNASTAAVGNAVEVNTAAAPIFTAGANEGIGTWVNSFATGDGSKTNLAIPVGNKAGAYTSNLTWTLTNAPQ